MEGAHLPSLNAGANEFLMFHGTKPEAGGKQGSPGRFLWQSAGELGIYPLKNGDFLGKIWKHGGFIGWIPRKKHGDLMVIYPLVMTNSLRT